MFLTNLRVSHIEGKMWKVSAPLKYSVLTVPTGFKTDLTTGYFEGTWTPASVIHDYALTIYTRRRADKIMREAMRELNVDRFNYTVISIGLLLGSLLCRIKRLLK